MRANWLFIPALCFLFANLAGCGGDPNIIPVTGQITLDGSPLANAEVTFTPSKFQAGSSMGTTDENGNYELFHTVDQKGAYFGSHIVSISKDETSSRGVLQIVPPNYNRKSKLTAEVSQDGPNEIDFDLESGKWDPKKTRQAQ